MAAQRTWLGRRKEILQILEKSTTQELERPVIENLFQVQKRTALIMMKEIGPVTRDNKWVVRKVDLVRWMRPIDEAADQEDRRRDRTREILDLAVEEDRALRLALAEHGRPARDFPLIEEVLQSSLQAMPDGVEIETGRITVHFPASDPQRLLEALYALGKALANDWESFVRIQTSPSEVLSHLSIPSPPLLPELPW